MSYVSGFEKVRVRVKSFVRERVSASGHVSH